MDAGSEGERLSCWGGTIGEGSVIGAGSVVVKDIPANSFAVGNLCRVIREINRGKKVIGD